VPVNRGKLVGVYGVAPAILQRAIFIAVLSFLFFLSMMIVYYIRVSSLFFLLATAFLLVYLVTMFSLVRQRRGVVQLFEHGIEYKKRRLAWDEIGAVADDGRITLTTGKSLQLPQTLDRLPELLPLIRVSSTGKP